MQLQTAVFGGGCFWCLEAVFAQLKGVKEVVPGYSGGHQANPTYKQVCGGKTGHAEVVKITFDPQLIGYRQLLEVFFFIHDPTTPNRQGNDIGPQYRSIILTQGLEQKEAALHFIKQMQQEKIFSSPIVTQVLSLEKFYPAEDYHVDYFTQNSGQPYCQMVVKPKLDHFRQKFAALLS